MTPAYLTLMFVAVVLCQIVVIAAVILGLALILPPAGEPGPEDFETEKEQNPLWGSI